MEALLTKSINPRVHRCNYLSLTLPLSLTALPELCSSSSRSRRLEVVLVSLTACLQSLLRLLDRYPWYLFYYLMLLDHRYPITLSPFEHGAARLFVFQASQPRHHPNSHDSIATGVRDYQYKIDSVKNAANIYKGVNMMLSLEEICFPYSQITSKVKTCSLHNH